MAYPRLSREIQTLESNCKFETCKLKTGGICFFTPSQDKLRNTYHISLKKSSRKFLQRIKYYYPLATLWLVDDFLKNVLFPLLSLRDKSPIQNIPWTKMTNRTAFVILATYQYK